MKSGGEGGGGGGGVAEEEEVLPMCHYVDDRKLMLQHVFASVPRGQIQAMLPPILKVNHFSMNLTFSQDTISSILTNETHPHPLKYQLIIPVQSIH